MEPATRNISDQFGRIHDYMRISLTERCNLRCTYCMPENGIELRPRSQFMTKGEVIQMAKIFVTLGVNKIRLTGGEPLVRSDAREIITELATLPVELAISTNGILVDKYLDTFIASGLKSVNVSLDSLKKDKLNSITRRNYFDTILSNINLLIKNNFHVKLNAVIIRGVNDDEIIDFIEFTKNNNVHFRFIEFMPFDGNKWDWSKGLSYKEIIERVKLQYQNNFIRIADRKNDTSKNFKINDYRGTFAIISSVTNPFCDSCNRIRLTADGKIKNCLFSDSETDLLSAMRKGEDIIPMIQEAIWHKKSMRGGMNTLEDFGKLKNRSMVAIGG
jgi:molybdenum cofactor biosynthesis protein A